MSFIDINWLPIFIPSIIGLFKIKYFDKPMFYLYLFVAYGVLNEVAIFFLRNSFNLNDTIWSGNLYVLVSSIFLGFYFALLLEGFMKKRLILYLIISFELYGLINFIFFQSFFEYAIMLRTIRTIIFVLLSIVYFYKIMVEANISNLWQVPDIWINSGILIYYSGNLFYTILFNLILEYSREFSKLTVVYFSALNALFYILIAIGFLKVKKQIILRKDDNKF